MLAALGLVAAGMAIEFAVAQANAQHISTDALGAAGWLAFWGGWFLILAGLLWAMVVAYRTSRPIVGRTGARFIGRVPSWRGSRTAEVHESTTDVPAGLVHSEISNDLGVHEFSEGVVTQPISAISMAAETERKATIKAVTKRLRTRWKAQEPKDPRTTLPEPGSPGAMEVDEMLRRQIRFVRRSLIEPMTERMDRNERELDRGDGPDTEQIVARDPVVRQPDEPPEAWTGQFWQGKQLLPCPWDKYRTTDERAFLVHRDTHTEPPTESKAQEVSTMPWPWAKVPIHFLGDGTHFFSGVPADPDHTLYATSARAQELIASGLYGEGPVTAEQHGFSGAIGRTIVCLCGYEAPTMADLQSHLSEAR